MTITTRDELRKAVMSQSVDNPGIYVKSNVVSMTPGTYGSAWRCTPNAAGITPQANLPSSVEVLTSASTGAYVVFNNPSGSVKTYCYEFTAFASSGNIQIELHDRLIQMGGLDGTATGTQTVGVDASVSTSNMANRRGSSDYSELMWWLEWYSDTGVNTATATVAVTYDDGSTDTVSIALAATMRAQHTERILPATAGRNIKSVQSVTLSNSTGTAGNFGVTVTRPLTSAPVGFGVGAMATDWSILGFPRIHDSACLFTMFITPSTTTGTMWGNIKLVQG